jgi:polysaccharide export outer membrane protein
MDISVLQPEKLLTSVVVSPDGAITFPYIGSVVVRGMTLSQDQQAIQDKLPDGYMKYPVVSVSLKESRSRKYFVYGEVLKPGTYYINENITVLRAITMAGGFTKFGSSKVKILRPKQGKPGYDTVQVNNKAVMDGAAQEDVILAPEDIVVVSQGLF